MKTVFLILFRPQQAFTEFGEDYADELHYKSLSLFAVYSLINFLMRPASDLEPGFPMQLFSLAVGISGGLLLNILLGYSIYWIGKKMGGTTDYYNIEATLAHSLVPIIIILLITFLLKSPALVEADWNSGNPINLISLLGLLFFLKINFQGVRRFNSFSIFKSILSLSPIFLLALVTYLLFYLKF